MVPLKCDERYKKNHPFLKKNIDDAVCLKNTPFQHFILDMGA